MNQSNAAAFGFLKVLKQHRDKMTQQQFRTLKGQAYSGDIESAHRGLVKILKRNERVNTNG